MTSIATHSLAVCFFSLFKVANVICLCIHRLLDYLFSNRLTRELGQVYTHGTLVRCREVVEEGHKLQAREREREREREEVFLFSEALDTAQVVIGRF